MREVYIPVTTTLHLVALRSVQLCVRTAYFSRSHLHQGNDQMLCRTFPWWGLCLSVVVIWSRRRDLNLRCQGLYNTPAVHRLLAPYFSVIGSVWSSFVCSRPVTLFDSVTLLINHKIILRDWTLSFFAYDATWFDHYVNIRYNCCSVSYGSAL
jgi:hypothetical protein